MTRIDRFRDGSWRYCFLEQGGPSKAAQNQVGIDNGTANAYGANAAGVNNTLFPFLTNELTNPQGFGQPTVNNMETASGQSVAGSLGGTTEGATLNAERTGNTAAIPGVIDQASRDATKTMSTNNLNILDENAKAKLMQQQEAAGGLGTLENTDISAQLKALGLSDESINAWSQANATQTNDLWKNVSGISDIAQTAAAGGFGGPGF